MELLKLLNLGLRLVLELCALGAWAYGGIHLAKGSAGRILMGAGFPIAIAVLWGAFGSPQASYPAAGVYRILLELGVFVVPAYLLYRSGKPSLAFLYFAAYAVNSLLMLVWKQ
jgi:hypothetical protein